MEFKVGDQVTVREGSGWAGLTLINAFDYSKVYTIAEVVEEDYGVEGYYTLYECILPHSASPYYWRFRECRLQIVIQQRPMGTIYG